MPKIIMSVFVFFIMYSTDVQAACVNEDQRACVSQAPRDVLCADGQTKIRSMARVCTGRCRVSCRKKIFGPSSTWNVTVGELPWVYNNSTDLSDPDSTNDICRSSSGDMDCRFKESEFIWDMVDADNRSGQGVIDDQDPPPVDKPCAFDIRKRGSNDLFHPSMKARCYRVDGYGHLSGCYRPVRYVSGCK